MVRPGERSKKAEVLKRNWYFQNTLRILKDPVNFLGTIPRSYGPIVNAKFGGKNYFVLTHPDYIQHVLLKNHKQYCKPGATSLLRIFLGEGLSTSNGELWLKQRRIIQPAFHRQRLVHILDIINEETTVFINKLHRLPAETKLNISHEFLQLTISIISRAMFSSALKDEMEKMVDALESLAKYASNWMKSIIRIPVKWPTASNNYFRKNCELFDRIIYNMIEKRKKYMSDPGLPPHEDLLDMLLCYVGEDNEDRISDKQLRDEVTTMFMAGHETTAQSLGWIFYHLAKDKQVNRRVVVEGKKVWRENLPAMENLPELTYTKQVINEGLRMYPPIWALVRKPLFDDEIFGVHIPASSYTLINIYGMHHHPGFWETPDTFNPEHFKVQPERPPFAFLPFGGGPRLCLGNNFATMVMQVVVSRLSRSFEFDVPDGYIPEIEPNISLRAKGGIQLILKRLE